MFGKSNQLTHVKSPFKEGQCVGIKGSKVYLRWCENLDIRLFREFDTRGAITAPDNLQHQGFNIVLKNGNKDIGIAVMFGIREEQCFELAFLGIEKEFQKNGYGGEALRSIFAVYKDRRNEFPEIKKLLFLTSLKNAAMLKLAKSQGYIKVRDNVGLPGMYEFAKPWENLQEPVSHTSGQPDIEKLNADLFRVAHNLGLDTSKGVFPMLQDPLKLPIPVHPYKVGDRFTRKKVRSPIYLQWDTTIYVHMLEEMNKKHSIEPLNLPGFRIFLNIGGNEIGYVTTVFTPHRRALSVAFAFVEENHRKNGYMTEALNTFYGIVKKNKAHYPHADSVLLHTLKTNKSMMRAAEKAGFSASEAHDSIHEDAIAYTKPL